MATLEEIANLFQQQQKYLDTRFTRLEGRLSRVEENQKELKTQINQIDRRSAFLFEATARTILREEYGSTFVKDFTAPRYLRSSQNLPPKADIQERTGLSRSSEGWGCYSSGI